MGWTLHYQLLRQPPLDDAERRALGLALRVVRDQTWANEPFGLEVPAGPRVDGLVARGSTKVDYDAEGDAKRVLKGLERLGKAVDGLAFVVVDDLELVRLQARTGKYALAARGELASLLDDAGDWVDAAALLPPAPPPIPDKLAQALAQVEAGAGDTALPLLRQDSTVAKWLAILAKLKEEDPMVARIGAVLAVTGDAQVAAVALPRWSTLKHTPAWDAVRAALHRVLDVAPLVPAFLQAWSKPKGRYFWADFASDLGDVTAGRLARQAAVCAQLAEDLHAARDSHDEVECRRAEVAAGLLGLARANAAALIVVEEARWQRTQSHGFDYDHHVRVGVIDGLARLARLHEGAEAGFVPPFATMRLELGRKTPEWSAYDRLIEAMAQLDPAQTLPTLKAWCKARRSLNAVANALTYVPGPESEAMLWALLREPDRFVQRDAAFALVRSLGERGVPAWVAMEAQDDEPAWGHLAQVVGWLGMPADRPGWDAWMAQRGLAPVVVGGLEEPAAQRLALDDEATQQRWLALERAWCQAAQAAQAAPQA